MSTGVTSRETVRLASAPAEARSPSSGTAPQALPLEATPPAPGFDWNRLLKIGLPMLLFALTIWFWESYVTRNQVPAYILPAPSAIWTTLIKDWSVLSVSLLTTLKTTIHVRVAPYNRNAHRTAGYQKMMNGRTKIFHQGVLLYFPPHSRKEWM